MLSVAFGAADLGALLRVCKEAEFYEDGGMVVEAQHVKRGMAQPTVECF